MAHHDHQADRSAAQAGPASALLEEPAVPQQPCSGTRIIRSSVHGSGASAASPDFVCVIKPRR